MEGEWREGSGGSALGLCLSVGGGLFCPWHPVRGLPPRLLRTERHTQLLGDSMMGNFGDWVCVGGLDKAC